MTQERLAELSELHLRSLQKIEAGEKNVLITTVGRIHRSLKCDWADLMSRPAYSQPYMVENQCQFALQNSSHLF